MLMEGYTLTILDSFTVTTPTLTQSTIVLPSCATDCPFQIGCDDPTNDLSCVCGDPSGIGSCIGNNCREGDENQQALNAYDSQCFGG